MKPFKYKVGSYIIGFNHTRGPEYSRIIHGKVLNTYQDAGTNWYDMEANVGIYKTVYSIFEDSIAIVCEE